MPKETKAPDKQAVAAYDWSQHQGSSGFENMGKEDLGIPFLVILQDGNPEVKKSHPKYAEKKIEGAGVGDIINNIARKVLYKQGSDKPLQVVPCSYERLYPEWVARESGGGIVKMHRDATILNETKRNEKGQDVLRNGNIIVTTAYFYCILVDGTDYTPCVVGMSSTQLKNARTWLNTATNIKVAGPRGQFTPPLYSHIYYLSTKPENNTKGSWMGWNVELGPMVVNPALITTSMDFAKRATSIQRNALPPPSDEGGSDTVPM